MQAKVAPLYFHSNKNCFISLSKTWTSKLPRDKILPFEVSTEDVTVYVSWAGSVSGPGQNRGLQTTDTVEINGLFGSKLGLKHAQEVLVTPLPDATPCERVYVEPISVNDWEILEMHSSFIESNLLNQIRVIWAEQTLPVWVQKSICVFVKIGRIESSNPSAKCYLLGQNTEVVVSPKVRSGGHHRVSTPVKTKSLPERTPTPQPPVSLPDFSTDARDSKHTTSETSAHATDALNPDQEDPLLDISGFSSLDNSFTEELSEATNPEIVKPVPVKPEVPQATSGPQIPPATSQEDITPGFDSNPDPEPSGIHQRFMRSISSWWNGDESSQDEEENSKKEEKKQKNLERDIKLDGCFRICALPDPEIHDVDPLQTNVMSPDVSTSYLRLTSQPTHVYVSRRDVLHLCPQENVQTLPSSFLATMLKLESPTEKSERLKEKMNKRSERTSALRKRAAAGDSKDMLEDSDTTLPCQPTVVRVIVLDCNQETSVTDEDGEKVGGVNMKALSWLPHNHVIVHNLLRKQLGLETSARVHLTSFRGNPHEISQLTLYRMFKKPSGFTKDMFETVFEVWLSRASNKNCPLLITQGTVVKCWLKEGLCGEFLLTFNHKPPSSNPPPLPYILLTEGELDKCQVKVEEQLLDSNKPAVVSRLPYYTTDQIDTAVPDTTVSQLGGVGELISAGLEHIAMCLACTPLTSYIFNHQRGVCNGGILICGLKGGGKTSLAHALCNQVASKSPWPYVVTVECKSLKGKRTENIRTHLESIFNELAWRQPAVLLLDDVDCIMSAASGPEQEMSGEAQYFTKNAEVLKELLLQEKRENTRLAVIATCKSRGSLHPSLTSPTGHHLFQETINIKPPNQETRRSILESVLMRRNNVNVECVKELDLGRVAQKTEGFVARDLESAIDRAIHANLVNRGRHRETEEKELKLNNTDLDTALEDFTPAALRNVSLHKAGDLGWCDVGGLHDVRHALVQTLEWPAKYPKLFASCPLRLRSGLLLYGAPGTGKTLLAGVVAKECGLNFISIKGPELLSKYIGASEQAVRDTFNRAQSARPCILFFDEFDSLAPRRGHDSTGVTDRVVNQLLTQLDGVEGLEGVYVLAATSRPDLIDPALLRPGRLDKALHCGLPAKEERFEILRALTRNMDLSDDIDLGVIAERSMNMTGADFKALLYNAQLEAVHQVTDSSVDDAPEEEQQSSLDTTKFVYLPNLEEGVTTLPPEKHAKLLQQVETCLAGEGGNRPAVEVTRGYAKVVVCQKHLENALSNLSPSVTDAERQKYQRIYEHFVSSRGGNFSDGVQTVGKRATLA